LAHTVTHVTSSPPHALHISMSTFHSPFISTLKMEAAQSSKTLASNHYITWCNNQKSTSSMVSYS
jgi:hypothetical protein